MENNLDNIFKGFDEQMKTFVESLGGKNQEELTAIEADVIKEIEEYEDHVRTIEYKLPKDVEFEGEKIDSAAIRGWIINFLSNKPTEWRYSRWVYEMCTDLVDQKNSLSYQLFAAVLEMLSKVTFNSLEDCRKACIINQYMSPENVGYYVDSVKAQFYANKHNEVMQAMEKWASMNMALNQEPQDECEG